MIYIDYVGHNRWSCWNEEDGECVEVIATSACDDNLEEFMKHVNTLLTEEEKGEVVTSEAFSMAWAYEEVIN